MKVRAAGLQELQHSFMWVTCVRKVFGNSSFGFLMMGQPGSHEKVSLNVCVVENHFEKTTVKVRASPSGSEILSVFIFLFFCHSEEVSKTLLWIWGVLFLKFNMDERQPDVFSPDLSEPEQALNERGWAPAALTTDLDKRLRQIYKDIKSVSAVFLLLALEEWS